jgi:hypothetical protein
MLKFILNVAQEDHLNDVNKNTKFFLFIYFYSTGISMRGNKDDVLRCLTEVYSVLEGVPPRGPHRYYDASTYNGFNVADYGGYSDNQQNSRGNNASGYANNSYVKQKTFFLFLKLCI